MNSGISGWEIPVTGRRAGALFCGCQNGSSEPGDARRNLIFLLQHKYIS